MKIDLHTHTNIGSACSRQSVEQLVADALSRAVDGVCITDHNNTRAAEEARQIGQETDLLILIGVEVTTDDGDFLVFGGDREDFKPMPYRLLREELDLGGCAIIPAHSYRGGPYRNTVPVIREFRSDFSAIEAHSVNMSEDDSRDALGLAAEVGLPTVACSDSHVAGTAGLNYTEFEDRIESIEDLVAALKGGRFRAVKADYDWRASRAREL